MLDNQLKEYLINAKSVAIIGAKDSPNQPVDRVGRYLIERGFIVYPVHPIRKNVWGLETYKNIEELALVLKEKNVNVDIICLFRASMYCKEHGEEVLRSGLKPQIFWMQEGIQCAEAGKLMFENGIKVVEDKCIKTEYQRLIPHEFECSLCGVCCEGENGIVVSDKDLKRILAYFNCSLEYFHVHYGLIHNNKRVLKSQAGYCVFYKAGIGCQIHEARPDVCRAWPYFRGNLIDELSFEMAKSDCNGIVKKATHSAFQKEGFEYLRSNELLVDDTNATGGNALTFSKAELERFIK